jgi:hypothetical protein
MQRYDAEALGAADGELDREVGRQRPERLAAVHECSRPVLTCDARFRLDLDLAILDLAPVRGQAHKPMRGNPADVGLHEALGDRRRGLGRCTERADHPLAEVHEVVLAEEFHA